MPEALKLSIVVQAGLIVGSPDPQYTRRWEWTSTDQLLLEEGNRDAADRWIRVAGESREYAATIETPRLVNWVRREWIWL